MGRYADLMTVANKLVPAAAPFVAPCGVLHALSASVVAVFAPLLGNAEGILAFPFPIQDVLDTQNQLAYYFLSTSLGSNGEYSLNGGAGGIPTDPGFAATDARRTTLVVPVGTESLLERYPTGSPNPFTERAPVIRYAEVLRCLAEARVRTTHSVDPQALALLNAVRSYSNPTRMNAAARFAAANDMASAILLERRIDFLNEDSATSTSCA